MQKGYKRIFDEQFHREALKEAKERLDRQVSEFGIPEPRGRSAWARGIEEDAHKMALEALALGKKAGIDGPAVEDEFLFDSSGRLIAATRETNDYGAWVWQLRADEAEFFGRKDIPVGSKSRVQKSLGLTERVAIVPAARRLHWFSGGLGGHIVVPDFPGVPAQKTAEREAEKASKELILVDSEGRRVDARLREGQWGPYWHLSPSEEAVFGKKFVPSGGKKRVRDELGLREIEKAKANRSRSRRRV
jgi:hypothetical protein